MKNIILSQITTECPWRDTLYWYDTIDSTNTRAKELAAQGASHGTVLIADHQTGGRGRLGRSFHSPAGCGIYLSVLLRPKCKAAQLMHLTCAVATAVCDGVEKCCGFRPGVKWINDLVANNKKLGGILTEMSLDAAGNAEYCVIGIGLNCKKIPLPQELRDIAVSLEEACGAPVDRASLICGILAALKEMDTGLLSQKSERMEKYRKDCVTLGKDVLVLRQDQSLPGTALDVDDEGGLLVRFCDGSQQTVNAGEVSVRGMYGYL